MRGRDFSLDIARDNTAFLTDNMPKEVELNRVMAIAREIVSAGEKAVGRIAYEAAKGLLDPNLPYDWPTQHDKIKGQVNYIKEEMQTIEENLFKSSKREPEPETPKPAHTWVRAQSRAVLQDSVEQQPKFRTHAEHQDIAKLLHKYYSATESKAEGLRDVLGNVPNINPKQAAFDKLVNSVINELGTNKDFWKNGGKNLVKGLLEITDVELSAKQASDLKALVTPFVQKTPLIGKKIKESFFDKIDAKSPALQQQREYIAGVKK